MSKGTKYVVTTTGKKFRGVIVAHGTIKDVKTGELHLAKNLKPVPERPSMLSTIIHCGRIGLSLYIREYWKYKAFFLYPALSAEFVNGYDRFVDFEIKFLCFGIGVRFIWIKKR